MPRSPQQNEALREQRKQEILQAALRVYVAKGYHGTEIAEVAQAAEVATGLIHYYFKSKKQLFKTLFLDWQAKSETFSAQIFSLAMPPLELIRHFLEAYLAAAIAAPEYVLFFQRAQQDQREVLGEHGGFGAESGLATITFLDKTIASAMDQGAIPAGSSALLAALMLGALDGGIQALVHWTLSREEKETLARDIAQRCLLLLSPPR